MRFDHHYNWVCSHKSVQSLLNTLHLFSISNVFLLGDKVIARKYSALNVVYEGNVLSFKGKDLICVQFRDDFVKSFDNCAYRVEFDFSRAPWIRQHFAIDMAMNLFGLDILDPKEIVPRKEPRFDVRLSSEGCLKLKNGQVLEWFNDSLNQYQRQAVANALRGAMLNPYVIYGPPGNKKYSILLRKDYSFELFS